MKTNVLLLVMLVAFVLPARGEEGMTSNELSAPVNIPKMLHWDQLLNAKPEKSGTRIGKSDYVFHAPQLEGLFPEKIENPSLGKRILHLPIIRLIVPQRMPEAPGGGGHYFAWREKYNPDGWTTAAGWSVGGRPIGFDDPAGH